MIEELNGYSYKLRVLRQIMSNKAKRYGRINVGVKIATVIVSSFLTFLGFAGVAKITTYVNWVGNVSQEQVEFAFNISVFALFVLLLLHLVFRFSEREAEASRAIVSITHLLNQVRGLLLRADGGYQVIPADIDIVHEKYDMLIQVIPTNTDREHEEGKKDVQEKKAKKLALQLSARDAFDPPVQKRVVEAVVRNSPIIMQTLGILRATDERLYLAGGPVRNAIWDYLHGYDTPTTNDDIDVVYFDPLSDQKANDEALENKLRRALPNFTWSVKNQARMHISNNEDAYKSLEDAISKWPEIATAIAVRLTSDDNIQLVAPFGYDDLFRLIVQPTPHFETKLDRYRERLVRKKWEVNWPHLRLYKKNGDKSI